MWAYAESSPVTTDDASCSVSLGLVSTQAPLISRSTRSAKLPFFQKAAAVVMIVEFARAYSRLRGTEGGRMHEMNWIFEQTSPPHFCLKIVCIKGGGGIFSGAYGITEQILSEFQNSQRSCDDQVCVPSLFSACILEPGNKALPISSLPVIHCVHATEHALSCDDHAALYKSWWILHTRAPAAILCGLWL